jgi:hypothetical protein
MRRETICIPLLMGVPASAAEVDQRNQASWRSSPADSRKSVASLVVKGVRRAAELWPHNSHIALTLAGFPSLLQFKTSLATDERVRSARARHGSQSDPVRWNFASSKPRPDFGVA